MTEKKNDRKSGNTLPVNTDDLTPSANITYNNEVVAIIAGLAANEVEGIAGMCSVNGSLMGKNRNITKGVKVEVGTEEVAVDLYVAVDYGTPIKRAAADAQENVRKAIESMTGLHVVRVDVHVQSVSFEQEKKALQTGAQNAALTAGKHEDAPLKAATESIVSETKPKEETKPASFSGKEEKPIEQPVKSRQNAKPRKKPVPKPDASSADKPDSVAEAKPD